MGEMDRREGNLVFFFFYLQLLFDFRRGDGALFAFFLIFDGKQSLLVEPFSFQPCLFLNSPHLLVKLLEKEEEKSHKMERKLYNTLLQVTCICF